MQLGQTLLQPCLESEESREAAVPCRVYRKQSELGYLDCSLKPSGRAGQETDISARTRPQPVAFQPTSRQRGRSGYLPAFCTAVEPDSTSGHAPTHLCVSKS